MCWLAHSFWPLYFPCFLPSFLSPSFVKGYLFSFLLFWDTGVEYKYTTLSFPSQVFIFSIWVYFSFTHKYLHKNWKRNLIYLSLFRARVVVNQWLECYLVLNVPEGDGSIRALQGARNQQIWLPMVEQGGPVFLYTLPTMKPIIPLFL